MVNETGAPARCAFVVGCRRSGTTWTMLLLAQHPRVVALQQADLLRHVEELGRWFRSAPEYGKRVLARPREGSKGAGEVGPDGLARRPLAELLSEERFLELARPLVGEVYARAASVNPDAELLVEQTPEYLQVWPEILRLLPQARFVHVVRDPRAVFCSHRNAARSWADPTRFSYDPLAVAEEWCADVRRGREIGAAAEASERYLELRYEDLRAKGPAKLAELYRWLGLEADESLCREALERCGIERLRSSTDAPRGFYRKGEAEGWREEMSSRELRTVEFVAGELMREVGYETVNPMPVTPPALVRLKRAGARGKERLARWAWNDRGPVRSGASRVLKAFPGLRRAILRSIRKPVG